MSSSKTKWFGRIFTALLIFALGASGYGLYRLDTERKILHNEIDSLTNRTTLLQKKYSEQKAMTEAVQREKQQVESQVRDAEFKLSDLEKEQEQLKSALTDQEKKMAVMRNAYEETIGAQKEHFASLRSSYDTLRDESNRIIKDKNQQINILTNERESLDASLKQESFQHKRCREHNSRFAVLTDELIKQYENKGILSGVGQLEPLTQLKQVEIEQICQEYRDKIDENTLLLPVSQK